MSSQSISLRNIPAEIVAIADAIAQHSGLSTADVYRLALACGVLVEATKVTPDREGTYAGVDGMFLAKALRRHLSSAIDLLAVYGESPQAVGQSWVSQPPEPPQPASQGESAPDPLFDPQLSADLESLGIGFGLSRQDPPPSRAGGEDAYDHSSAIAAPPISPRTDPPGSPL